jgi:hypothetical protein
MMVALSVTNRPTCAVTNFFAIVKIHKYKGLHEGHHFILMAMEVHNTLGQNMDNFIRESAHIFQDRCSRGHLSLFFCIHFLRQRVSISFQHALTSAIKRKIALKGDACSRPPITIRFHNLHVGDIKRAVNEIASYHKKD